MSAVEPVVLVMAKAPVPGRVKTRLAAEVGVEAAADLAALSLLDTLDVCETVVGASRCHLALAGSLADARHGEELARRLRTWTVHPQVGAGFGQRLARAHADVAGLTGTPVVQIGMDTPQLSAAGLESVVRALAADEEAVLGLADDGGWWVLAVRDPRSVAPVAHVEMSTSGTGSATRRALEGQGVAVGTTPSLRDVDTAADADSVCAAAPATRFARRWAELRVGARAGTETP